MPNFTVMHQRITPITGLTGAALSRDAAIVAAVAGAPGPTGREVHIYQTEQIAASGPTGTFAITRNTTEPLTGSTFSAATPEAAAVAAVAAGPTGPGAGIDIKQIL